MMKDKLFLITGVSGMLGSSLSTALSKKGFRLVGCDIREPLLKSSDFIFEQIDLRNKQAVFQLFEKYSFDYVIHTAAYIKSFTETKEEEKKLFLANVTATSNLVLASKNVEKFIFTSSMTVYGLPQFLPVTENHPKNPMDYYGKSKLMAENVIQKAKIKHIILRFPGIISNTRKTGAIYYFVKNALENKDIHITAVKKTPWEIIFLEDAVCAVLASVDNKEAEGIFNIGYGETVELVGLAKRIKDLCNSHSNIINDYPIKHPSFYMDTKKAEQVLNIHFPSLSQRLKEFIQICKMSK